MVEKRIDLAGGQQVTFTLNVTPGADSTFVLGVRKCGSSIMNSIVQALAKANGRHFVDVAGSLFKANIPEHEWRDDQALLKVLAPGNVYGGFRAMPRLFADHPLYKRSRKILLVRDPRDALVSEYFSNAFSHSLPAADAADGDSGARAEMLRLRQAALSADIDAQVMARAAALNRTMMEYQAAAADPATRLFRYEDVILNKRPWIAAITSHFGWTQGPPGFVDQVLGWADVVPTAERSKEFVRKVVPGDHKDKLSPAVIAKLNVALAPSMALFGYGA